MAVIRAFRSGNWSDTNLATSPWSNGSVVTAPGNGDTVYANTFNVTVDQDVLIGGANNPTVNCGSFVTGQYYEILSIGVGATFPGAGSIAIGVVFLATGAGSGIGTARALATITNEANATIGASVGGSFIITGSRQLSTNVRGGTASCLNITATSGTIIISNSTITGNTGNAINNSTTASLMVENCQITILGSFAINNAGTGIVTINNSNIFYNGGSGGPHTVNNASSGNIFINNSILSGGGNTCTAVRNAATGTITVVGCILNGATLFNGGAAVQNDSTGTILINNSSLNANTTSNSVTNASTGRVICTNCIFTAINNGRHAISSTNTSSIVVCSGVFNHAADGTVAIYAPSYRIDPIPTNSYIRYARNGTGVGSDAWLYQFTTDSLSAFSMPPVSSVRFGTTFANNALTGTCVIPSPSSVSFGVPVDNTTGISITDPLAFFNYPLSAINTPDTIGDKIKKATTVEAVGQLIASFSP